jgi:transposase
MIAPEPVTGEQFHRARLSTSMSVIIRTLTGAKQFCAIRSYLSTAAKHHQNLFDTLVMLAEGRPWTPA